MGSEKSFTRRCLKKYLLKQMYGNDKHLSSMKKKLVKSFIQKAWKLGEIDNEEEKKASWEQFRLMLGFLREILHEKKNGDSSSLREREAYLSIGSLRSRRSMRKDSHAVRDGLVNRTTRGKKSKKDQNIDAIKQDFEDHEKAGNDTLEQEKELAHVKMAERLEKKRQITQSVPSSTADENDTEADKINVQA